MAEDLSRVSVRAERKALQKAKILQRESERKIVQLVRLEVSPLKPGSASWSERQMSALPCECNKHSLLFRLDRL